MAQPVPTPAPGAAGFKERGTVRLPALEMEQGEESLDAIQALLEHDTGRH